MTILPFFVLLAGQQQGITYSCKATRLSDVLPVLSEKTGKSLKVAATLERKFAVLRFKDTPVDQALQEIAEAFNAKWVDGNNFLVLQANADSSDKDQKYREAIRKYLGDGQLKSWTGKDADALVDEAVKVAELPDNAPTKWDTFRKIDQKGPQFRVLKKLLNLIGERALSGIQRNTRVVYSTSPTRKQLPFPAGADAVLKQFIAESVLQNEALRKKGIDEQNPSQFNFYLQSLQPSYGVNEPVTGAMLSLERGISSLQVQLNLQRQNSSFGGPNDYIPVMNEPERGASDSSIKVEGSYEPSPDTTLIAKAMKTAMGGQSKNTLTAEESKAVLAFFSDLEKNELLGLAPSEIFLQIGEKLNKDVVANLSDLSLFTMTMLDENKTPLANFARAELPWSVKETDRAIVVNGLERMFGIEMDLPRRTISQFVKSVAKSGVSIDALADLYATVPDDETGQVVLMLSMIPFGRAMNMFEGQDALRLYGGLDPGSRAKAKQGGFVTTYVALPPALQAKVNDYVYRKAKALSDGEANIDEPRVYGRGFEMDKDATTMLPNGIPPDTRISFQVKKEDKLFTISTYSGGYQNTDATELDEAASQLAWSEKTQGTENSTRLKFATGTRERLDVMIQFAPKVFVQTRFSLNPSFKDADMKDVGQLPDSVRKDLEERLAKQREALKDVKIEPNRPPRIKP